jgi:transcriptional regulator with XRE-family HTH domain
MRRCRVKDLAKERHLTQVDLTFKSGTSLSIVQRLWQNREDVSSISYKKLEAVAAALGVSVDDLFESEDASHQASAGNRTALVGAC